MTIIRLSPLKIDKKQDPPGRRTRILNDKDAEQETEAINLESQRSGVSQWPQKYQGGHS